MAVSSKRHNSDVSVTQIDKPESFRAYLIEKLTKSYSCIRCTGPANGAGRQNGGGGGGGAGGRQNGAGGGGGRKAPTPKKTAAELDAELDAYVNDMKV